MKFRMIDYKCQDVMQLFPHQPYKQTEPLVGLAESKLLGQGIFAGL